MGLGKRGGWERGERNGRESWRESGRVGLAFGRSAASRTWPSVSFRATIMAVPAFAPAPAAPVTKVSLSLSLNNLPDLDIASKTDAKILVFMSMGATRDTKIGQTEKAKDTLNPKFATPIVVDYYFEAVQELYFVVGDVDDHKTDAIGSLRINLGSIVGARGQQVTANLVMARSTYRQATITIRAEEVRGSNQSVVFNWAGSALDST